MLLTDQVVNRKLVERTSTFMSNKPWLLLKFIRRDERSTSSEPMTLAESREQKRHRLIAECGAIARADAQREAGDAWVYDIYESSAADT